MQSSASCARASSCAEVVDVAGRDERQARASPASSTSSGLIRCLHVEVRVLQLDVDVVAAEDLREPVELGARRRSARLSSSALQTRPERQPESAISPPRVPLEQLPVDARLVVVALEVAERRELDQVRVALVRLGEQRQVRVALLLRAAVVGDVDLAADDRLDARASCAVLVELDRAGQRAVVGERDRRHLELAPPARRASGIRHAPSRIEYSEWTWRWTKAALQARAAHRTERTRRGPAGAKIRPLPDRQLAVEAA